jgi:cysteine desulfurase/selenocysteine lyase
MKRYYSVDNANVHRGAHLLSQRATADFEGARETVRRFLNATEAREIIFVRGVTEGINLAAQSWGRANLKPGDEVLITWMEHHSNIVPWQMVCQQTGAILRVAPIDNHGELVLDEFEKLLGDRTRLVSLVHLSNSLGTINPVRTIIDLAHSRGVPVLLDGAQSASHLPIDVRELDCDFFVFSGHKVYGPTGIGVLYGKAALLEAMPPWQGGGDMIRSVSFAGTTYADLPNKFEAGTPAICEAIGLGAAIDYLQELGLAKVADHEDALLHHATELLHEIPGLRLIGSASEKAAILSFVLENPPLSSLDVGTRLDLEGIAVRTGHHCCQPVMERFGIPGTVRASFGLYNTMAEVERFAAVLGDIVKGAAMRTRVELPTTPEPTYPPAAAASPDAAAAELADVFDFLDEWTDRYQYLIELGEKLPTLPAGLKTEANRVRGCQSTVFMSARKRPGTADVVDFLADSDADIVRGLLAVLQRVFSGQRAGDILAFDVGAFFRRLGLDQNLSMGRRNGLDAMIQRVRAFATSLLSG